MCDTSMSAICDAETMFTNTTVGRCADRSEKEGVCNGETAPSLSRIRPFSAMPRGALQLVYSSVDPGGEVLIRHSEIPLVVRRVQHQVLQN